MCLCFCKIFSFLNRNLNFIIRIFFSDFLCENKALNGIKDIFCIGLYTDLFWGKIRIKRLFSKSYPVFVIVFHSSYLMNRLIKIVFYCPQVSIGAILSLIDICGQLSWTKDVNEIIKDSLWQFLNHFSLSSTPKRGGT